MEEKIPKELLQEWRVDSRVPADFNGGVWRRIEKARPHNLTGLVADWLNHLFAKPALAAAYVAVSLLIGLGAGQLHAGRDLRTAEVQFKSRYIQSVDPYAMPLTR